MTTQLPPSSSMDIEEVFLTMIPSMGIEIFGHKNSFDLAMFKISTKLSPYKFFSLFKLCWGLYLNLPNILFENEVIHSYPYFFCEKPDFVDFPRKTPIFLIRKRILRVKILHISETFSSYKQIVFSAMGA